MSFSNPLQLSGRQLENYNNTQRALENIKSHDSSQQQLFSNQQKQQQQQSSEQKSVPQFGVVNSSSYSDGNQSNVLGSQRQNTLQQKQVSFSENSGFKIDPAQPAKTEQQSKAQPQSQGFQNTPGSTPQGESRLLFNGNQQRSTRRQENPEDAISELVHHSDKTIRQLEDQFKSLNAGSSGNQRVFSQDKSSAPVSKLNGAKIQHIKSEVDRLIMQAEIQNKQSNLGIQNNNNNRDSRYSVGINNYDSRGRDFSGSRREEQLSSSPRKHKRNERSKSSKKSHSKKKDHHRSRKGKHSKREYNSDDTSSYSGESDSIIMEQENESNFDESSNEENYEEDERKSRKHNKHKHSKHHQEQAKSDTKSYLQELEARSMSNYSKNPSQQQRKRTPSNHSLRLDKDNLKKLPSYGLPPMNKGENSVYSSASRMRQQQQLAQTGQEGFRRCPEENENNNRQQQNYQENRLKQGKNHRNEEQLDDSFDIHEDFQIYNSNKQGNIKSSRVSGIERPSKQAGNERNQIIAQSNHRRAAATSDDDDEEDLYKPYVVPEKSNYSQKVVTQQVRKDISARAYEQQRQTASYPEQSELALGLAAMEEDSVIFCVNCEEYIKAEKVDEHSNICQSNKDNRTCSQREYIQNINEKLTKIRYLIKSKHNHLLSFSRNTTSQQELGLFQSALDLISVSIDSEIQVSHLNRLISDLKEINKCLARSGDTSQHSLLYLSQKGIEFIQRKSEFLSRYGNDKFDGDDGVLSYIAPSEHSLPNNRNFDEVSYASSTIRQGTNFSKQKRNPIQIFSQIDNDLNIFKPKQQQNSYGAVIMSPPQKGNGFKENSNQFISPKSNYSTQNEPTNRQERMYQKPNESHEQQGQNIHNYAQQNQQQQQQQQQQQFEPLRNFNRQQNSHPFSVRGQQPEVFTVEEKNNRQLPEQNQRLRQQQQEQQQNVSQPFQTNPPRQQPFSQKAPTFLEPVETITVKEAQISRPSNQRNSYLPSQQIGLTRQMNQEASNLSSLGAQKQRFFQLAHSLKPHYPSSNKFLIAELWNDAQKNNITENNWNQFLISKFS